ncbi:HNH endonuclease [Bacillus phage Moonbeam]|uniref:Homing endonuclease n=1 Tax=Bacillus phage Moonbeam TaxID=1540091 RepID=A0A0A0RV11_9CAUD|nr:HNH endonuclease [Bacillus phage Moonbeam]AIW03433.1 homing endonuclease [Bacillus phage Moonbeam]
MPVRKTNAQWVNEVRALVNDEYTFLEEYVNKATKIAVVHNLCGNRYKVVPGAFLRGNRCPNCNPARRRTTDEFRKLVYNLVGSEYTVVSEYTGHHKPITLKHEKCSKAYEVAPSDFLKGRRCKQCYLKDRMKTNQEWLAQVQLLAGDDYIFLEEYKGDNVKIKYKHLCGTIHEIKPNNFINGTRCPKCNQSKGEKFVETVLKKTGVVFEAQKEFDDLRDTNKLSYDFLLASMGILIEYQGLHHYEPVDFAGRGEEWALKRFKIQKRHDEMKRRYAKDKGYTLIEIPYKYDSYEKVEQLLVSTITNKL